MKFTEYKPSLFFVGIFALAFAYLHNTPFSSLSNWSLLMLLIPGELALLSLFSIYLQLEPDVWSYLSGKQKSVVWRDFFRRGFTLALFVACFYSVLHALVDSPVFHDQFVKMTILVTLTLIGIVALLDAQRNSESGLVGSTPGRLYGSSASARLHLAVAAAAGLVARLFLFTSSFKQDEFQHLGAAVGYLNTGRFALWNFSTRQLGESYPRAWLFTWQVAQAFKFLGVSPWSGRLVSLAWGMATIFLGYLLAKRSSNDYRVGLLAAWIIALSPFLAQASAYIRMYSMFVTVFLIFAYFSMMALEGKDSLSFPEGISWPLAAGAVLVFFLSFLVHVITLVTITGIVGYLLIMAVAEGRRRSPYRNKYFVSVAAVLSLAGVALIWSFFLSRDYFGLHFVSLVNNSYYFELAVRPFPMIVGVPLLVFGVASSIYNRKLAYLASVLMGGLFFFAFIGNRYPGFLYISNLLPLSYLFMAIGLLQTRQFTGKKMFNVAALIIVGLLLTNTFMTYRQNYLGTPFLSPSYDKMYAAIEKRAPKGSTVWLTFPRDYYLARHKGLLSLKIRDITTDKQFTKKTVRELLERHEKIFIVWDTNKGFHIKDNMREFISNRMQRLEWFSVNYGFEVYVNKQYHKVKSSSRRSVTPKRQPSTVQAPRESKKLAY